MHRRGIDRGGDVHELEVEGAARQLQRAHVAHEREVRVVDGERQLALIVERGGVLPARRRGRGGQRVVTRCCATPTASAKAGTASQIRAFMSSLLFRRRHRGLLE